LQSRSSHSLFSSYCFFKDIHYILVIPNCMPYPWVASNFFYLKKNIFLLLPFEKLYHSLFYLSISSYIVRILSGALRNFSSVHRFFEQIQFGKSVVMSGCIIFITKFLFYIALLYMCLGIWNEFSFLVYMGPFIVIIRVC
jgi:hypothetical protein